MKYFKFISREWVEYISLDRLKMLVIREKQIIFDFDELTYVLNDESKNWNEFRIAGFESFLKAYGPEIFVVDL